jgi:chromosome segregation ATPase
MFGWFKKRDDKRVDELESSIKNSFQNMRTDMSHVSKWITHFKTKHEEHHTKIEDLHKRIELLEELLAVKNAVSSKIPQKVRVKEENLDELEEELPEISNEKELPEAQMRVCECLAALQREEPNSWSSLPKLAAEVYPGRDYEQVRSAILQLVNVLEAEGFVAKKKVRKSVYVYLRKEKANLFSPGAKCPEEIPKKKRS